MGKLCLPELKGLQQMLHEVNPYVSDFKHAVDVMHSRNAIDVRLTIVESSSGDARTHSATTAAEIAVLLP